MDVSKWIVFLQQESLHFQEGFRCQIPAPYFARWIELPITSGLRIISRISRYPSSHEASGERNATLEFITARDSTLQESMLGKIKKITREKCCVHCSGHFS